MLTFVPRVRVIAKSMITGETISDLSPNICTVTTNKMYRAAAGTFQITTPFCLVDGKRYDQILIPNNIITIEIDAGKGAGYEFVMLGLVDRVARTLALDSNGNPERRVVISGRDFGKLLSTVELSWDISGIQKLLYPDGIGKISAAYLARYANRIGSPEELVGYLFSIFQTQIPGAYYVKYFDKKITTDDTWKTYAPEVASLKGTVAWDAMKRLSNEPYNALTTNTNKDGRFELILENTPFNSVGKIARGTLATITSEEMVTFDVGAGDAERINLLCLWPPTYKTLVNGVLDIALAYPDMTRLEKDRAANLPTVNGFCAKIIEPIFVPKNFHTNAEEDPDDVGITSERKDLFWEWFKKSDTYESGTMVVHARPDIRQGEGIVEEETGMEYFVEQISHAYSSFPNVSCVSQLQLTRGQPH